MLKIASKATKVWRNSPSDAFFWDTRTMHPYYVSIVTDINWDKSINLDCFQQGERFGKFSTLTHHKVEGHIENSQLSPDCDGWPAYYEFIDSDWPSGQRIYRIKFKVEWKTNYTAYLGVCEEYKTRTGERNYYYGGHAFRLDPTYYDIGVIYYAPKIVGNGFDVFVEDWASQRDYYRYNDTHKEDVGVDLSDEQLKKWAIYYKNVCDSAVSEDRQDSEAIHDTCIRDMVDDVSDFDEVNNIGNAIQIFDTVRELVTGKWTSLLSDLKKEKKMAKAIGKGTANVWLRYRYEYTTTKSDIEAEIKRAQRSLPTNGTVIGRAGMTVGHTQYHATCIARNPLYAETYNRIYHALGNLGLAPTWANLWDLVPFSFIVDWFQPFADFSEQLRLSEYVNSSSSDRRMSFDCFCYSAKTKLDIDYSHNEWSGRISLSYYDRSAGSYPTVSSEIAWYRQGKSKLTWSKRILDAGSMIIGFSK